MEDKDINILEEFISNYKDIQEMYKDDEIQAEIERSCYFEEVPAKEIETILNELERLQKENKQLKEQVNMFDVAYSGSIKESKKWFDIAHDSIPKQVIRDKFKRINETKIKSDKINARNYMIFGDTERATGWFINLDYIEKILLDVPGYKIGE